jgi:hypothetical protein
MNIEKARKICEEFASKHKVIFEDEGECGFGRECVGFIARGDNYVAFNPTDAETYEIIEEFECDNAEAPDDVESYHKHDCMAVLGRGDEAIIGLAKWVEKLESFGNVRIVEYPTGAKGMQAMFSGITGYTVMCG